ncbi:hypothetical protein D3C85_1937340 [compost metagenome]
MGSISLPCSSAAADLPISEAAASKSGRSLRMSASYWLRVCCRARLLYTMVCCASVR